jgi:hypothetical protein
MQRFLAYSAQRVGWGVVTPFLVGLLVILAVVVAAWRDEPFP